MKSVRKFNVNTEVNSNDDDSYDNIEIFNDRQNKANVEFINSNDLIKVHDINFTFSNTYLFKKSSNKINLKINTNYDVSDKLVEINPELHLDYTFRNNLKTKTKINPIKNKININLSNFEYIKFSERNYTSWFLLTIFPHPYIKSALNYKKRNLELTLGNKWTTDYISLETHLNIINSKFGLIGSLPLHDIYSSCLSIHTDIFKTYHIKYNGKLTKGMKLEVSAKNTQNKNSSLFLNIYYKMTKDFKISVLNDYVFNNSNISNIVSLG
jgi:hypothetical protein